MKNMLMATAVGLVLCLTALPSLGQPRGGAHKDGFLPLTRQDLAGQWKWRAGLKMVLVDFDTVVNLAIIEAWDDAPGGRGGQVSGAALLLYSRKRQDGEGG